MALSIIHLCAVLEAPEVHEVTLGSVKFDRLLSTS
jgi:hypothetical protein